MVSSPIWKMSYKRGGTLPEKKHFLAETHLVSDHWGLYSVIVVVCRHSTWVELLIPFLPWQLVWILGILWKLVLRVETSRSDSDPFLYFLSKETEILKESYTAQNVETNWPWSTCPQLIYFTTRVLLLRLREYGGRGDRTIVNARRSGHLRKIVSSKI